MVGHGGVHGQGQGLGDSQPRGHARRVGTGSSHPGMGGGYAVPPSCCSDPSKVRVGCCGPLSCALGDGDMGLSPVTSKRIALAGAVGGCGRAPPPAETGCRRR